jgi:hypothetical protein
MTTTDALARRLHAAVIAAPYKDWRKMYAGRKTDTGITLDGADTGKVWVRAEEDSREETQVWGSITRINLPVWVGPNITGELEVKAVEQVEAALTAGAYAAGSLIPPQTPENNDNLIIGGRQFRPGRMRLSDLGGLYVYVEPFHYDGGWWPGGSLELTPTATADSQAWVAVALNPADGTLYEFAGADFSLPVVMSETDLGTIAITAGYVPVGAVVLYEGQTTITGNELWADFHYHYAQAGGDISGFVALVPDSDTRNTVQPSGDHPAIIVKNNAGQTDNPFQAQTSAGAVNVAITPLGGLVVNEQGADADTRIEGDTDANLLFVDASTDRVGIGTGTPAQLLDVDGTAIIQTLMTDASTELTIASGAITVTQTFHRIDTEADASTDDLATINGGTDGQFLIIRAENTAREVVVTTAGNITTSDGNSVALDEVYKFLLLVYDGNRSKWNVVGGGGSGSGTYYQTIRDAGTPLTQRGKLNFIEGADITLTIADDSGNDETEVMIAYSGAGGTGTLSYSLCQGRLTLTTGLPVTTSDVTAATTLYFTPYKGNQIGLYSGSAWEVKTFSEISLSLSGYTADKNYDIWVYNNSGTVTLDSTVWTDDTTRATALTTQDGVYVKTGATTRRYLGTIRITGTTGQTEDSVTKRFVWNYYNRTLHELTKTLAGGSYNSATWRQGQNDTSNQVALVVGVSEDVARFLVALQHQLDAGEYAYVGIGLSSTTTNSAQHNIETYSASSAGNYYSSAIYRAPLAAGYHYITWLESVGSGTVTSARATLMGEAFA